MEHFSDNNSKSFCTGIIFRLNSEMENKMFSFVVLLKCAYNKQNMPKTQHEVHEVCEFVYSSHFRLFGAFDVLSIFNFWCISGLWKSKILLFKSTLMGLHLFFILHSLSYLSIHFRFNARAQLELFLCLTWVNSNPLTFHFRSIVTIANVRIIHICFWNYLFIDFFLFRFIQRVLLLLCRDSLWYWKSIFLSFRSFCSFNCC